MAEYAQTPILVQSPYFTELWTPMPHTRKIDPSKLNAQQLKFFNECSAELKFTLSKTKPEGLDEYQTFLWNMADYWWRNE